jgi:K+-sensing histidine kinase KdpD
MEPLKTIFALPPMENESDQQIAQILRVVLLFFGFISLAYFVLNSIVDTPNWERYAIQGSILLFCMLLGLVFLHKGYVRPVAILETLAIWLVFTAAAYTGGGVRSSGYFGYLVVLVVAGVLSGKRLDTILVSLLCVGAGYFLVYAEMNGLLPPPQVPTTSFLLWVDSLVYFSVVAGLLFLTMRVTYNALQRLNHELVERQRAEQVQSAIYRISEAANSAQNLNEVYGSIYAIIRELMPASRNLYIALYDPKADLFRFPFVADESDENWHPIKPGKGLTNYVYQTGKPLLATPQVFEQLEQSGNIKVIGRKAVDWLGVPLKTQQGAIGVMAIQTYTQAARLAESDQEILTFVSNQVAMVIERKQAEEQIRQSRNQLATLNEIGRAVSEVTDLGTVLEIIRQQLEKLLGFDFYSVRVFNAESRTVTHLAVYESGKYWDEADAPLVPGTDAYKVFETGESVLHLYTEEELEEYKRVPLMQIGDHTQFTTSVIFVPLKKQGKTIGALSVQRYAPNTYTEEHFKLVEAVAIQVAIAIENARLFTHLQSELAERRQAEELTIRVNIELQRRIKELYALNAVALAGASAKTEEELLASAVETLHNSLYPDIVGVALWDESAGFLRTFPGANIGMPESVNQMILRPHEGIAGLVAATRQPYRLQDTNDPQYISLDPSIRSELCVPILAGERLLGVLDVESRQFDAFSDTDENLLATVAGQLAASLERLHAEQQLRALNADLEQRVSERTAQLEAANKELEAFSYSVSHDLRAPLRSINGFAKILNDDFSQDLSLPARGFLRKIANSGRQMAQLIDELLDFSRLGRKPLNIQTVNLNELVQSVIESLATETGGRQIEWGLAEMPPATADPALLRLVYANLVGNAVKYTAGREAARIEVSSFVQDGETVYFVRDNGAGFDMQYADNLFGVFQRLHREDEFEGTGIGLATVKRIINRHGGRVWAEAEVDKGATFYFTFK